MTQSQYKQQMLNVLKEVEGVQVLAIPLYEKVPTGIKFEMPVLFRVMVGDNKNHKNHIKRQPIHICFDLDRSGSMAGAPLENSKHAIKHALTLLEPDDKVSLVVYDHEVSTVFENKSPMDETLISLINGIKEGGWTNISGGLIKATEILNREESYQKIVFLFSDGQSNRGITDLDSLGTLLTQWVDRDKIRFSAFGIGTSYDEKWMRSIARGGEGSYFFIDRMDDIHNIVEKGLSGFTQVIGNMANLKIHGTNGNFLISFQGDKTLETLSNGKTLPYLRNLGLYEFITMIEISGSLSKQCPVVEYQFAFQAIEGLEKWASQKGTLSLEFCDDLNYNYDYDLCHKNPDVVCCLMISQCAEINHKVDIAMKIHDISEVVLLKKEIIAKYESVLSLDKMGSIGALLEREKKTLKIIEKEGVTERACKSQEYNTSYGYNATATAAKCNWEKTKMVQVEEDSDMGFSLFD